MMIFYIYPAMTMHTRLTRLIMCELEAHLSLEEVYEEVYFTGQRQFDSKLALDASGPSRNMLDNLVIPVLRWVGNCNIPSDVVM